MNEEMKEILRYLEPRNDYVICAGFAQYAHLGTPCSADIDTFVDTPKTKKKISADFEKKRWRKFRSYPYLDSFEKNETTFDILYSENASKNYFSDTVVIEVYSFKVRVLSREALFLMKLSQLFWDERTEEKRRRDWVAVNSLKLQVDTKNVKELIGKMPDSFWRLES
jgi:hypothetical protein